MKMLQLSPFVQIIKAPNLDLAMIYHSLLGGPLVTNKEGVRFLELFRKPVRVDKIFTDCEGDPSSLIKNFVEQRFLCKPDFDERSLLRTLQEDHLQLVAQRGTIDRMGLAVSDVCNFACRHCLHFQPESGDQKTSNRQLLMSWDTAHRCVDSYLSELRNRKVNSGKIHFGNAEPLLNWGVIKRVLEYCASQRDINFHFAINTNLSLLTKEIAECLKLYRVTIATSLDGTRKGNDSIRQAKNGTSTYDKIIKKFDLLVEIGYPLDGFSITVTEGNFDLIDERVVDLAIDRGMVNLAFDYDLIGLTNVPVKKRVNKLMRLKQYANSHGIDFFGTWDSPFRNLSCSNLATGKQFFCAAVEGRSLEFNTDGSIKVCGHSQTKVGHVDDMKGLFGKKGGLTKLVETRLPGNDSFCRGCPIEGPCSGQCHVTREMVTKNNGQALFKDMCSFYCEVTRAMIQEYLGSPNSLSPKNKYCSI